MLFLEIVFDVNRKKEKKKEKKAFEVNKIKDKKVIDYNKIIIFFVFFYFAALVHPSARSAAATATVAIRASVAYRTVGEARRGERAVARQSK